VVDDQRRLRARVEQCRERGQLRQQPLKAHHTYRHLQLAGLLVERVTDRAVHSVGEEVRVEAHAHEAVGVQALQLCRRRRGRKRRIGEQHAAVQVRVRSQGGSHVRVVEHVVGRLHDQRAGHASGLRRGRERLVRRRGRELLRRRHRPRVRRLAV